MYPLALSGRELLSIFNQCCTFSTVFSIFLKFFLTFCLSQSCEFYRIPVTPKFKLNLSNSSMITTKYLIKILYIYQTVKIELSIHNSLTKFC